MEKAAHKSSFKHSSSPNPPPYSFILFTSGTPRFQRHILSLTSITALDPLDVKKCTGSNQTTARPSCYLSTTRLPLTCLLAFSSPEALSSILHYPKGTSDLSIRSLLVVRLLHQSSCKQRTVRTYQEPKMLRFVLA